MPARESCLQQGLAYIHILLGSSHTMAVVMHMLCHCQAGNQAVQESSCAGCLAANAMEAEQIMAPVLVSSYCSLLSLSILVHLQVDASAKQ